MNTNRSSILLAMLAMSGSPVWGQSSVNLSVNGSRPVAAAVESLEQKYGYVITYEDPRYVNEGEIADVTEKVRKDLDQYPPGKAPRVLIPKGGKINISYNLSANGKPEDPAGLIQSILNAGGANAFRFWQDPNAFHVVPASDSAVLDAKISLVEQERSGVEAVLAICDAVSRATNTTVAIGSVPNNLLFKGHTRRGAVNENAREVLGSVLADVGKNISWQLFHDPGLNKFVLNLHVVSDLSAPKVTKATPAPKSQDNKVSPAMKRPKN